MEKNDLIKIEESVFGLLNTKLLSLKGKVLITQAGQVEFISKDIIAEAIVDIMNCLIEELYETE